MLLTDCPNIKKDEKTYFTVHRPDVVSAQAHILQIITSVYMSST